MRALPNKRAKEKQPGAVSQRGWKEIDYQPAIRNHPPQLVLEHVQPGSTVLDIGCNRGNDSLILARHGFRVLGIDVNKAAIEKARMHAQALAMQGSADFRVADVLEEPFTDQFDVVLLIRVLTCFSDESEWSALLKRTVRLLKPRGFIYIDDFVVSRDIEAYRVRYEEGAKLGWREGNFQVDDRQGNHLFIAHHHSPQEIDFIRALYEDLSYRSYESLSMNGNACRMFEFFGRRRA